MFEVTPEVAQEIDARLDAMNAIDSGEQEAIAAAGIRCLNLSMNTQDPLEKHEALKAYERCLEALGGFCTEIELTPEGESAL